MNPVRSDSSRQTADVRVWQLKQSAHQLIALSDGQLHFSTKLSKREAEAGASADPGDRFWTSDRLCSLPVSAVTSVRVNNSRRSVRVVTTDHAVEAIGFASKSGGLLGRMGQPDKRRHFDPVTPTGEFGAVIAQHAGLEVVGDPRSDIVHYGLPTAPDARFTTVSTEQPVVVRPWLMLMRLFVILMWMTGIGVAFSGLFLSDSRVSFLLQFVLPFLFIALGAIAALGRLAAGVAIDENGVSVGGLAGCREVAWVDVDLVHTIDAGDWFIRRQVEIVRGSGNRTKLPLFSQRQADVVAEAFVRFGVPRGVNSSVFHADFKKYRADGSLTKSPINDGSRI